MLEDNNLTRAAEPVTTFSVIVPSCGRIGLLSRALHSIQAQSLADWECIVVNDEPAAMSAVNVLLSTFQDRRMKVYHNRQNEGVAVSRNEGILQTTGKYVAFLDDDDYWLPGHLEGIATAYSAIRDATVLYTNCIQRWQGDIITPRRTASKLPPEDVVGGLLDGSYSILSMSMVCIPRFCFTDVGLFDCKLRAGQDWDIYLRLAKYYGFIRLYQYSVVYFHHYDGRLTSDYVRRLDSLRLIAGKWKLGPEFVRVKASHWKYMALDDMLIASSKDDASAKLKAIRYFFSFPLPFRSPVMIFKLLVLAVLPFGWYVAISRFCRRLNRSGGASEAAGAEIHLFDRLSLSVNEWE